MNESERIKQVYEARKLNEKVQFDGKNYDYSYFLRKEREYWYGKVISKLIDFRSKKLIEIGAGHGDNLFFFERLGISRKQLFANELIDDRIEVLKNTFPEITIFEGDARNIDENQKFDIVFQSTVFSSILNPEIKMELAAKMENLVAENGLILWYDFFYDNPQNKNVKGIGKNEIKKLFPKAKNIIFKKITLAPPIARRVGKYYDLVNFIFPFLKTHFLVEIHY